MDRKIFLRKYRLLNRFEFNKVFENSQLVISSYMIIYYCLNNKEYPRIGFAISRKCIKHAHERNRIKRLVREYFRIYRHELPLMDFIVLVKLSIIRLNNNQIIKLLEKLWQRCHQFV